jgi:hypothetical protein
MGGYSSAVEGATFLGGTMEMKDSFRIDRVRLGVSSSVRNP